MNVDPAWIRIAWLALFVLGGSGFILYIIAWIAIPEAAEGNTTDVARVKPDSDTGKFIIGGLLILVGGSLLINQYVPWMRDLVVPAALIAVGTGVIIYSVKK